MNPQPEDCIRQFRLATDYHQRLTRDAVSGKGVDRHLFALYIMSKFLRLDSPFLKKILSEPWRLSTSQTATSQSGQLGLAPNHPDAHRCLGGGFGPVDKNGYGVSYIFSLETALCFHVSSCFTCPDTVSFRTFLSLSFPKHVYAFVYCACPILVYSFRLFITISKAFT
ncbi:hypothetical protein AHF37_06321 [Paragonimus kellicotti]|nr:hypothetical protein AHF37_06321 [Paragonimus kellicotti]